MISDRNPSTPAALTVCGVQKQFASRNGAITALDNVSFTIPPAAFTAILGASGCGKSTLLKIIAGIESPDAGSVMLSDTLVDGPKVHLPPEARNIGFVPQEGALFPHLSVFDNVAFGLRTGFQNPLSRRLREQRRTRVADLLALVGLEGYERRRPSELSGGQQQRIALARALSRGPSLVLLDEPFSALDAGLRAELRLELKEILRKTSTTAVLVTHDQDEALSLADTLLVMRDGSILQSGSPTQLYSNPDNLWTGLFVGEAVLVAGERVPEDSTGVRTIFGRLVANVHCGLETGGPCTVLIRPEQIVQDALGVPARVRSTRFFGHDMLLDLDVVEENRTVPVTSRILLPNFSGQDKMLRIGVVGPVGVFPSEAVPEGSLFANQAFFGTLPNSPSQLIPGRSSSPSALQPVFV